MTPTSRRDAAPLRVTLINLWPRGGMAHYTAALANALRCARAPSGRVCAFTTAGISSSAAAGFARPWWRRPWHASWRAGAGALP